MFRQLSFFLFLAVFLIAQVGNSVQAQVDTDGDGVIDEQDLDDDNDGISDVNEGLSYEQTGFWATAGTLQYSSNLGTAQVTFSFSTVAPANVAANPNGLFANQPFWAEPAVPGSNSFEAVLNWDGSPEPGGTDIDDPADDQGSGTLTITFDRPVINPVIHLDRIGGNGDNISSSALLTLTTPGLTLERLTGTDDFEVTPTTIQRVPDIILLGGGGFEAEQELNRGTAAGSVLVRGTVTTISFDWRGVGVEGAGGDGIEFILNAFVPEDTDNDGVFDHLDLDADNDGIYDLVEAQHSPFGILDPDGDGQVEGIFGLNGLLNPLETNDTPNATNNYTPASTDADGSFDFLDLDADNDGCNDVNEAGFTDTNNNGLLGNATPAVNADGVVTSGTDGYTDPGTLYIDPTQNSIQATASGNSPVCEGFVLSLSSSVTGTLTNLSYGWTGPDGFTSTQANPSITSPTTAASGVYTLTAESNGCTATDTARVRVEASQPPPDLGPDQLLCPGQPTLLNAGGGYDSYLWSNGATSSAIFVSLGGTYSVTVTSTCGTATDSVRIDYVDLSLDLGPDTIIDFGDSLVLDASNPNFVSYDWNTGATSAVITVTQAGTYEVTASSSQCGTVSDEVQVGLRFADIAVSGRGLDIPDGDATPGAADGTFIGEVCVTEQFIDGVFRIENVGDDTLEVSNLALIGQDSTDFTVLNPSAPFSILPNRSLPLEIRFNASASGTRQTTVEIRSNDPDEDPYTFAISGEGTAPITNFLPDTTVLCADEGGSIAAFDPALFGPPTIGYAYLWSNPETGAQDTLNNSLFPLFGTPAPDTSTYSLLVYEPTFQCIVGFDTARVVRAQNPRIRLFTPTSRVCTGEDGVLVIDIDEGNFPMDVTYEFEDPATGSTALFTVSNLQSGSDSALIQSVRPGRYRLVSATNAANCNQELSPATITIQEVPAPSVTATVTQDRFCLGETTELSASGALEYQYFVNGFVQGDFGRDSTYTPDPTLFTPGLNELRVLGRTATGCPLDTVDFEITVDSIPLVSLGADEQFFCPGDTFTLDTDYDQNTNFSYFWANAAAPDSNIGLGLDTFQITQPGQYFAQVENVTNGCIGTSNIVDVRYSPVTLLDLGADRTVCDDSQLPVRLEARDLSANDIAFQWYELTRNETRGTADTLLVDTIGVYAVEVFDSATQCTNSDTVRIQFSPDPNFEIVGHDPAVGSCAARDTLFIQRTNLRNMEIVWNGPNLITTYANDSAAIVGASGVYTAQITDTSTPLRCTETQSIDVTLFPSIALDLPETPIRACETGRIRLDASDPSHSSLFTYSWTDLQTDQEVSTDAVWALNYADVQTYAPQDFAVEVSSPAGCSVRDTLTVQFERSAGVQIEDYPTSLCAGETLRLSATGTANVVWSTGATATSLNLPLDSAGFYSFRVRSAAGTSCAQSSDTAFVRVFPTPALNLPDDTFRLCQTDSMAFNAARIDHDSATVYRWTNLETETVLSDSAFFRLNFDAVSSYDTIRYEVLVRSPEGCENRDTVRVRFDRSATVEIAQGDSVNLCLGETIRLDAANAQQVRWRQNTTPLGQSTSISIRPEEAGIFTITAQNETGNTCGGSRDTTLLYVFAPPSVRLVASEPTVCAGASVTLTASGAQTYQWAHNPAVSASQTQVSPLEETLFEVFGTDANGCSDTDTLRLRVRPFIGIAESDLQACAGEALLLNVLDTTGTEASYRWFPTGETREQIEVTRSGSYRLEATTENCVFLDTVAVTFAPYPTFRLPADTTLCFDSALSIPVSASLTAPPSNWRYRWTDSAGVVFSADATLDVDAAGLYIFTVTAVNPQQNCVTTDTLNVIERCTAQVFVPQVFSPNGDGLNDTFEVFGRDVFDFRMNIYNRWGVLIYQQEAETLDALQPEDFWDGTYQGRNEVTNEVFQWEIRFTDRTRPNEVLIRRGRVTVLR